MTLESRINRNRYIGNGATTDFPFTFKVWKTDQILVYTGDGTAEEEVSSDCTVTITASGGTVSFPEAPASGTIIVIRRNMPYIQEDDYRNGTRFDSEEVEDRFDQDCAERQDLRLDVDRCIKIAETSNKSPEEFQQEFWDAYDDTLAKHDAVAEMHAEVMAERPIAIALIKGARDDALHDIEETRIDAVGDVTNEGDHQVQRVENAATKYYAEYGNACMEVNWTLTDDIAANTDIDIDPLWYVVGRHHLQVSVNGVHMYRSKQFNEKGTEDQRSSVFTILVDLKDGDTINVWVGHLAGGGTATSEFDGLMSHEDKARLDGFDLATTSADGFMSKEDKLKLDGIASSTSFNRATTTLANAVTAGTEITVPTHIVGEGLLFVWHNGVLCEEGASNQYIDFSTSSIKFNYDLPAGDTITAGAVYVSAS